MEIGLSLYGLCGRITIHPEEEQCDMGYRGSTHENGSLRSHEKHMDIGSVGPSLYGGDSSITWSAELYSVRTGYKVLIGILAEAARGLRHTVTLQYSFSPNYGWTD